MDRPHNILFDRPGQPEHGAGQSRARCPDLSGRRRAEEKTLNQISSALRQPVHISGVRDAETARLLARLNRELAETLRRFVAEHQEPWTQEGREQVSLLRSSIFAKEQAALRCDELAEEMEFLDRSRPGLRSISRVVAGMWPAGHPLHDLVRA